EKTWKNTGHLKPEDVELPPEERLEEGPVAIVECPQKIPCDPCSRRCPVGAIEMEDINETPSVNFEKCTGCSTCVQYCPGLAIFLLDCSSGEGCQVTLPYEFDLPAVGEEVLGLDRKGKAITTCEVKGRVTREESAGDTSIVTVKIPETYVNEVRNIRRKDV
ncbi:MAG: NADH-quinone oxidoreductase subunit I, partial [Candidatus Bipolaricaulota bacterium]